MLLLWQYDVFINVLCLFMCVWSYQCQAVKAVEREPYTGEVVAVVNSGKRDFGASDLDTPTRPCTRHGGMRDLHESSFSLSGEDQQIQTAYVFFHVCVRESVFHAASVYKVKTLTGGACLLQTGLLHSGSAVLALKRNLKIGLVREL